MRMNTYKIHTGKAVPDQAMEAYSGSRGIAPFILTSALDSGK